MIDINTNFIEEIDRSELHIDEVQFINQNILDVPLIKESDLVLSIFAYHHVCDSDKIQYIKQIENALKKGGTVILTEIFIPNKQLGLQYYRKLFDNISLEDRSSGLRRFLQQTAKSEDFEFKVSKEFADKQFEQMGFKKIEETKIRPIDDEFGRDVGTFVQVYQL